MHGFLWFLGVYPVPSGTSAMYQLWSGLIPALTVVTLLGAVVSLYHVHNCHYDGCWRIGKHRIAGTPWCTLHVDQAKPQVSAEDLLAQILDELRALRGSGA